MDTRSTGRRGAGLARITLQPTTLAGKAVEGFPTKSIVVRHKDTGSDPVTWYPSKDGEWLWKKDCSSDKIDGHFYG